VRYLFDSLDELERTLLGKRILLLLDFDGTLSPIAPTPAEATLPSETRRELERLVKSPSCDVAVISGRALSDVKGKVGIPGITYVGNHGLEVARPDAEPQQVALPQFQSMLRQMKEELAMKLAPYAGAILEDKGNSLAVHYRTARREHRPLIKAAVYEAVEVFGGERQVEVGAGAMVLELRPPIGCDKGTIVSRFLESESRRQSNGGSFAIYIGDDVTDEDAFRAIRGRGWGILVGPPRISYAEYYLRDPGEVRRLLHVIGERCKEAM
jgi:trehalose-phosphatase